MTLKQIHSNVTGYKETEIKSWVITLGMKDMIKVVQGGDGIKYVLALAGFIAWDNYPRK